MKSANFLLVIFGLVAFSTTLHAQNAGEAAVPGEYIVELKKSASRAQLLSLPPVQEARPVALGRFMWIKTDPKKNSFQTMAELVRSPYIQRIEPNFIYRINSTEESPNILAPNDEKYGELWGLRNSKAERGIKDLDAERAWFLSTGSKSVLVAVIDTGVDYNHEDLKNNMWVNTAEQNGTPEVDDDGNGYVDDIHGYDTINDDGDPMDEHNHGTHVAGTIGAEGNNGIGVAGVNWTTQIMAIRTFDANGASTAEAIINAITYAHKMNARVLNNSWGGFLASGILKDLIAEVSENNQIFVAAAGNNGFHTDLRNHFPSGYNLPTVISVGATESGGFVADFSNYGMNSVDVYAPGADILSTVRNDKYARMSGTSMATPHIAGLAALILSHRPELTARQVKELIVDSSVLIADSGKNESFPRLANAYRALSGLVDNELPSRWSKVEVQIATDHPYKNNQRSEWEVILPGASEIALYFSEFDTERDYDVVQIFNDQDELVARLGGKDIFGDRYLGPIAGERVRITFESDEDVSGFGFEIPVVAYRGTDQTQAEVKKVK